MISANQLQYRRQTQAGVGLLEVMIAVVVLSFGLLGLVGLQLTALRSNQSAMERSNAVMQSYSIIDAMRADLAAAGAGDFDIAHGAAAPGGTSFAAQQLAAWRTRLVAPVNGLGPSATGSVDCVGAGPIVCTVEIRWDDSRGLDGSSTQTITTEAQL